MSKDLVFMNFAVFVVKIVSFFVNIPLNPWNIIHIFGNAVAFPLTTAYILRRIGVGRSKSPDVVGLNGLLPGVF
jgi:hypothetical protein